MPASIRKFFARIFTFLRRQRAKRNAVVSAKYQVTYFEEMEYEVDPADFPAYPVPGQSIQQSPWHLSLYHMVSLQLYYPPEVDSAKTFKDLVKCCYKQALRESVPIYDGSTDVNVFLDKLELNAALQRWTLIRDEMLPHFLKDAALDWYINNFDHLAWDEQPSWMELRKCLQLAFPQQRLTDSFFSQFDRRSQGPFDGIQPYILSVLDLCRQCDPTMDEDVLVVYIQVGLNSHYKKMVNPKVTYRLQDLWDALLSLEHNYPALNVKTPSSIA